MLKSESRFLNTDRREQDEMLCAGLSAGEIGERIGLSQSPCWRRIRRMEEDGIIEKRVAILDRSKLDLGYFFLEVEEIWYPNLEPN